MDSFEWNKVSSAVIVGILLYMGVGMAADSIYHVDELETSAYVVEGLDTGEAVAVAAVVVEEGPSLAELMATASADKGARVFRRCQACHTVDNGGAHKVGPNLWNTMGAAVGGHDGFGYSDAVIEAGGTWSFEYMDAWLASPAKTIPGNKMSFAGLRKEKERADLMAYLNSLSDTPLPLPQ